MKLHTHLTDIIQMSTKDIQCFRNAGFFFFNLNASAILGNKLRIHLLWLHLNT